MIDRTGINLFVLLLFVLLLLTGTVFLPESATAGDGGSPGFSAAKQSKQIDTSKVIMLGFLVVMIVLFFWEPMPLYVLALSIPGVLVLLQPWTELTTSEAISGFSSEATIAILCMFILSEGIRMTGFVQILGDKISDFSGSNITKQLAAITGLSGPTAGFINNTPVVAIFIPMISNLARRVKTSPSYLMIPLSYASMMGGTLTLVGSSTNLLASDLSARLLDHPISFFEFTGVGVIILISGTLFLILFGKVLIPERIDPEKDLAKEFEMGLFLTELVLDEDFEHVGKNVEEALDDLKVELDLVQIIRESERYVEPLQVKTLRGGDRLIVRTELNSLLTLLEMTGISIWSRARVSEEQLERTPKSKGQTVVETVIPTGSFLEGQTLEDVNFVERYDTTVLAIRRGEELTHTNMDEITLKAGDVLLLLTSRTTLSRLRDNRNFIVVEEIQEEEFRRSKMPVALGILGGVILLAATGALSIAISALLGTLAMTATGCLDPDDLHEAVDWEVVFLLAGLIPLGLAMEKTGTAHYLASSVLGIAELLPPLGVLSLFYLLTAVMTNLIHKNASVIVMIPITVDAAQSLGLEPFPFLIAVMLAASTAFLTPVGNHTNLMVYGPGGYHFQDFLRVGAPLQVLLAIVTPLAITLFWSL